MFSARKVHVLVRGGHGFSMGSAWLLSEEFMVLVRSCAHSQL
jgi:hypothetical protein